MVDQVIDRRIDVGQTKLSSLVPRAVSAKPATTMHVFPEYL